MWNMEYVALSIYVNQGSACNPVDSKSDVLEIKTSMTAKEVLLNASLDDKGMHVEINRQFHALLPQVD